MANGNSNKSLLGVMLVGLIILAGGAGAYKFWTSTHNKNKGEKKSNDYVINDPTKKIKDGEVLEVPFILWGGDTAMFLANGGLETKPDSIFGKQGLKIKLVRHPDDDFDKQVKDYNSGKSKFLRGTMSMLGQASEELLKTKEAAPVVILQLTWSAGDHMVARANCKTLDDLKGKKIALQEGGPHVGMLNDILRTARLEWKDVTVVWTKGVSGDQGPAALFRKDNTVDACFAISPEMTDLTGGLDLTGSGEKIKPTDAQPTVKDAHVLVSTAQMSRSIADVYACRKDFFDNNRELVDKFVASYLKACEELIDIKKSYADKDKPTVNKDSLAKYKALLKMTQDIYGNKEIPSFDDADGLISDATFVGLPGNISFFTDSGNLSGYKFKQQQALAIPGDPSKEKFREVNQEFPDAKLDYNAIRTLGDLKGQASREDRFVAEIKVEPEKTIYFFTVNFDPNEDKFPEEKYGVQFQRALEQASLFGNAVVAVRGHADPALLVQRFLKAATEQGLLTRKGSDEYLLNGKPFDPNDTKKVLAIIEQNNLSTADITGGNPQRIVIKDAVRELQSLSDRRSASVLQAVTKYAENRKLRLEKSQMRSFGAGITEPIVGFPKTEADFAKNRRVEFRIIKVPSDAVRTGDFDF